MTTTPSLATTDSPASDAAAHAVTGAAFVRASTRRLHDRAEAATGLPGSLRSAADVLTLLERWRRLACELEPRTESLVPSLVPALDADIALLADLTGPGSAAAPPAPSGEDATATQLQSPVAALGVAWVLLGARLGLRSIAEHVETLTGASLRSVRSTRPTDLRDVRARLDGLAPDDLAVAATAAGAAFEVAIRELGGPPWTS